MRFPDFLAAIMIALPAASAAAAGIEIRHDPVRCVPADRYGRITAAGTPAEGVARAELQFRVRSDGEWYSILMAPDAGAWSAMLPRPNASLSQFEYRLVMTGADLSTAETEVLTVRVVEDAAQCIGGRDASVSVAAPIVVRVPPDAPLVPPVPPGFSPAGVVAAEEAMKKSGSTKKWVAVAGIAGGVAAAAVAAGSAAQPAPLPSGVPAFQFFGANPAPGSVLSLSRDRLSVSVRITGERRPSLHLLWRVDLLARTGESACVMMFGESTVFAQLPQVVGLTAALVPSGSCGPVFDVGTARLTIMVGGHVAHDQTHVLPYHFVP